jgi:hypothetical protein
MIGHTCRMWMHLIRLYNIVIRIDSHENIIKGPLRPIRYASPAASSLFDSLSISIALNTARRPVVIPPNQFHMTDSGVINPSLTHTLIKKSPAFPSLT